MLRGLEENTTKNLLQRLMGEQDSDLNIPPSIKVAYEALVNLDPLSLANLAKDLWPKIFDFLSPQDRIRLRTALATSGKKIFDNYTASNEYRLYTIAPSLLERIDRVIDEETFQLRQEKAGWLMPCSNLMCWTLCLSLLLWGACTIAAVVMFSKANYAAYDLNVNLAMVGVGGFLSCLCIVCPVVSCLELKIDHQYKELELYLMSSPQDEKDYKKTQRRLNEVYLYMKDTGPYIRMSGTGMRIRKVSLLVNFLDPDLFIQPKDDPQKCEDKKICAQVLQALENRGVIYARTHILGKPISALPAFDDNIENAQAYREIRKTFAPETTLRKVVFDVQNKYLGFLEDKREMKIEVVEDEEVESAPSSPRLV